MKTRFAPSPTGLIHPGNARTALFNALLAGQQNGHFLLRIEDSDQERSKNEYIEALMSDLHWLGVQWQEGPDQQDKGSGPYLQSQRTEIYSQYFDQLITQNQAYPCFCSSEELRTSRVAQRQAGLPPRYAGTCAHLNAEQVQRQYDAGRTPTLRFRVPATTTFSFDDLVKGPQRFASKDIGDFIIRKTDGMPAFFFCNAIDDALMEVTQVLRGEDHLTNTPRQIALLQALNLTIPQYGHFSLITGQDNAPLSKRNGSHSLNTLKQQGYLPQALLNYMARLGHQYRDNNLMSVSQLSAQFSLEHISRSPAHYDAAQLNHWQQEALQQADHNTLWHWLDNDTQDLVPPNEQQDFIAAVRHNILFPQDLITWTQRVYGEPLLTDDAKQCLMDTPAEFFQVASEHCHDSAELKPIINALKNTLKVKGKALFMPLRAALTGTLSGPELGPLLALIKTPEIKRRLNNAQTLAQP